MLNVVYSVSFYDVSTVMKDSKDLLVLPIGQVTYRIVSLF